MILQIVSVFDNAAKAYMQPAFVQNVGVAIRSFSDAANQPEHDFSKHASDFTMFHLGSFDDENAAFDMFDTPAKLVSAHEVKES